MEPGASNPEPYAIWLRMLHEQDNLPSLQAIYRPTASSISHQPSHRAKTLLVKPSSSVTDIALTVGFSETSSFTAAFRKGTGPDANGVSPKPGKS